MEKEPISMDEVMHIFKAILMGFKELQRKNIIHRDIKPTNILLTNSKVAKITDFGLSKFYNLKIVPSNDNLVGLERRDNYIELTNNVGTERYMAPEIIQSQEYDCKSDIYSCGILLYELFENKRYIPGKKLSWYWCPKNMREIINTRMLCDDKNLRYDALTLLKLINRVYPQSIYVKQNIK